MSDMRLSVMVEMFDKFTSPMRQFQDQLKKAGDTAKAIGGAVNGVVERMTTGYAGIAGAIGGGIALREIAKENDYFNRLRILSGKSAEEVDNLRHSLTANAREAGISGEELKDAFTAMREGGLTGAFTENAKTLADAIQLLNGSGYELGQTFVSLNRFMGIKAPEDLAQAFATLREQLKGIPGGLDALAPKLGKLTSDMAAMGRTGLEGAREIGAIYAIARPGAASSREAVGTAETLIGSLRDMDFRNKLKNLGITVAPGASDQERAINEDKGQLRSPVDIIRDVMNRFKDHPAQLEQFLGGGYAEALKVPLGQMKATGKIGGLETAMNATGDIEKFKNDAEQLGTSFEGSINRMRGALAEMGEKFAPVINLFASVLSVLADRIGSLIAVAGGLIVFAKVGLWLKTASVEVWTVSRAIAGPLIAAIGNFVIALRAGYGVMEAFNLVLMANPIGLVVGLVTLLAGAAYLIYENWDSISAWFKELWDGIVKTVTKAIDAIKGLIKTLPTWLGGEGGAKGGTKFANDVVSARKPSSQHDDRERADPNIRRGRNATPIFGPNGAVNPDQKQKIDGTINVKFDGAPENMRVTSVETNSKDVSIDTYMGYALGAP